MNAEKKKVLLVAGTGTLGGSTYPELVRLGYEVDVLSLEDYENVCAALHFIRADATTEYLADFLRNRRYAAIVDFVHTVDTDALKRRIDLLLAHTDQFVFVSSYRTYANRDKVITEDSPQLLDVVHDEKYLATDDYSIPKTRGERYLASLGVKNYTIIRPIISFTHYRLDLVTVGGYALLYRARSGKRIPLPEECRDKHCGVTWGGNTGLQIAHLIGKEAALGEAFSLGTSEGLTWGDVAGYYEEFVGARFVWIPAKDYLEIATSNIFEEQQMIWADRNLDRNIDFSKVMRVTGLDPSRFLSCREAIARELTFLAERPDLVKRFDTPFCHELDERMDAYFAAHQ